MYRPQVFLIAACDAHGIIGKDGKLPWHLPEDLRYFKKHTVGHPIVMGHTTWESLPKKPLPKRHNIVLSRTLSDSRATIARTTADVFTICNTDRAATLFVIGGAATYQTFFPYADRLYITEIAERYTGDTFFPEWDHTKWRIRWRSRQHNSAHMKIPYCFTVYEKRIA